MSRKKWSNRTNNRSSNHGENAVFRVAIGSGKWYSKKGRTAKVQRRLYDGSENGIQAAVAVSDKKINNRKNKSKDQVDCKQDREQIILQKMGGREHGL